MQANETLHKLTLRVDVDSETARLVQDMRRKQAQGEWIGALIGSLFFNALLFGLALILIR